MKVYRSIIFILTACLMISCSSDAGQSEASANSDGDTEIVELKLNPDGLPTPDLGITVVNPDGWTEDQMSFQQNYCLTMFEKLEGEYDSDKFCLCFLDKVQYYYKPVYIFEAFEDQKTWNSYCLKESGI